jgi:hypothetical protein
VISILLHELDQFINYAEGIPARLKTVEKRLDNKNARKLEMALTYR